MKYSWVKDIEFWGILKLIRFWLWVFYRCEFRSMANFVLVQCIPYKSIPRLATPGLEERNHWIICMDISRTFKKQQGGNNCWDYWSIDFGIPWYSWEFLSKYIFALKKSVKSYWSSLDVSIHEKFQLFPPQKRMKSPA